MARLGIAISLATALELLSQFAQAQDRPMVYYPDPQKLLAIDADSLSVSDRNRTATFFGHTVVTQGAVHMRCSSAVIYYHSDGPRHRGVIDRVECEPDYLHLID